ncbi:hypothetical protein K437DRAFT_266588 [Tilletiaria anomala UBC 951]|uniref:Uncharacterized protein n=1 Tax=Tilletiaria anomala (strain ATCC 24038 / CBS 436.72 / UBC 951) TaxID=1037660 RepID=A0A066WN44_TILAU|nr:uncharacterized protein K437DRAFT_266588 [Tilletiaria anomala UBC 951]KDN52394.1 hypothetical protein K437DRAFT_266588 [Tilletiaria anomala UBC 951]
MSAERQGRKEGLLIADHASASTRSSNLSSSWRAGSAGGYASAAHSLARNPGTSSMPTPWQLPLEHDLDTIERQSKDRRHFELPKSLVNSKCLKYHGSGKATCSTCKDEPADESR